MLPFTSGSAERLTSTRWKTPPRWRGFLVIAGWGRLPRHRKSVRRQFDHITTSNRFVPRAMVHVLASCLFPPEFQLHHRNAQPEFPHRPFGDGCVTRLSQAAPQNHRPCGMDATFGDDHYAVADEIQRMIHVLGFADGEMTTLLPMRVFIDDRVLDLAICSDADAGFCPRSCSAMDSFDSK